MKCQVRVDINIEIEFLYVKISKKQPKLIKVNPNKLKIINKKYKKYKININIERKESKKEKKVYKNILM